MPLLHFFELTAPLDSRVLVLALSLSGDTFCLHNVIVYVALNSFAHLLHSLYDLLLLLAVLQLPGLLFVSEFLLLFFVDVISLNFRCLNFRKVDLLNLILLLFVLIRCRLFLFLSCFFLCNQVFQGAIRSKLVHHCLNITLNKLFWLNFLFFRQLILLLNPFTLIWILRFTVLLAKLVIFVFFWTVWHLVFTLFKILFLVHWHIFILLWLDFLGSLLLALLFVYALNLLKSCLQFSVERLQLVKQILDVREFKQNRVLLDAFSFEL